MTKLYAVYRGENTFAVVKAESEEEAFNIYAEHQVNDEIFREYITQFFANDSLLAKFYKDDDGYFFDYFTGDYQQRLKVMSYEDRNTYINLWIEKNVKAYWHDQPQFAHEYIRELRKSIETEDHYVGHFSDEFMIDTIKRIIKDVSEYEAFGIAEINLATSDYQLIFES